MDIPNWITLICSSCLLVRSEKSKNHEATVGLSNILYRRQQKKPKNKLESFYNG